MNSTLSNDDGRQSGKRLSIILLLAMLAAGSTWFYFDYILKPMQVADAAAHDRPRGNLSDLYPRWLGARELLLHGRNPYSRQITLEIQQGYYGRQLDRSRPNDPKDQQGFAYPLYVVFLLAPLIGLPFQTVQVLFYWTLIGLTALSVPIWLRTLGWRIGAAGNAIAIILVLGSLAAVQGFKLQQMTLLVAALLAIAIYCLVRGWMFFAGVILAFTTIKPQLVAFVILWVILWSLYNWKTRRATILGFAAVLAGLLIGSEFLLRGWVLMFLHAIREYHDYTQNKSVLDVLVNWAVGPLGGSVLGAIAVVCGAAVLWRFRAMRADTAEFARAICLVLALSVLVVPMYAPYNQILLIAPVLLLWRESRSMLSGPVTSRALFVAAVVAIAWPWIASLVLAAVWLVARERALQLWQLPLYSNFAVPVLVFVMMLLIMAKQHLPLRLRAAAE